MRRFLPVLALALAWAGSAGAHGLLIPAETNLPPLAMVNHRVTIAIDDQVAVTRVEQTFRNHTDRQLEATYVFPVPKGASVNQFTMWVGDREVKGELLEAAKARQVYTDIVRRTQDPGLLEYMGSNMLRMRVFPVPAKGEQKVALKYTAVAPQDAGVIEYVYPLKTDGKATRTLEDFSIQATIKSQHAVQNVYSPTHAISLQRPNDREVHVRFERNQALLDKDFQLFYATGDKDIGFTTLAHRPISSEKGYFLLLVSPRVELPKAESIPRDMVLVLDTSGSMRGAKMDQARRALKYCLSNLESKDRFALINFATTVNKYRDGLTEAVPEQLDQARKWVDNLEATGGTAINDALAAALDLRPGDNSRTFTVVFFTDGLPTIGETNVERILKNALGRNTANTRIFTFGVGDDVNATFLDQLADQTRAVSTYVRPAEDIEAKVSALYSKISHPVLANLKLTTSEAVRLEEIYPPQLPDLFHGGQLVVLGRYSGRGSAAVTLTGTVGKKDRQFVYEVSFPDKTNDDKEFVEQLWARRKVGYLLEQIRANGEKKELVDETVALAKKYGIATPYTSYLIVPDAPVPVAAGRAGTNLGGLAVPPGTPGGGPRGGSGGYSFGGGGFGGGMPGAAPPALYHVSGGAANKPQKVEEFARKAQQKAGDLGDKRSQFEDERMKNLPAGTAAPTSQAPAGGAPVSQAEASLNALREARDQKSAYDKARSALQLRRQSEVQEGKLGVDLSVVGNNLRTATCQTQSAVRCVNARNCMEIGGVWIDEGFDAKTAVCTVKAQSDAYFRILEKQPRMKEVFKLGNYLVWLTPSGTALVIDTNDGKDKLSDEEIDKLFVAKK
jgi:Ca-activated chloride channel family protein